MESSRKDRSDLATLHESSQQRHAVNVSVSRAATSSSPANNADAITKYTPELR
jgi:hypothetical protein